MLRCLQEAGVQMHAGYLLAQYVTTATGDLSAVTFTSLDNPLKLDCAVSWILMFLGLQNLKQSLYLNKCDL